MSAEAPKAHATEGKSLLHYPAKAITGIAGYVKNLVLGTVTGTFGVAVGTPVKAVTSLWKHAGNGFSRIEKIVDEAGEEAAKEKNIGKLGPVIKGIVDSVGLLITGTLKTPFVVAGEASSKALTSASKILSGLVGHYESGSASNGNGKGGGQPKPAHAAAH